jgi:hypothetical protein
MSNPWDTFTPTERRYLELVAGVALPDAWVKWTTYLEKKNGKTKRYFRYPRAKAVEMVRARMQPLPEPPND